MELLSMVNETVSHSVLKSGELISLVFVNFPVPGGEHTIKMSRALHCDLARDRSAEENVAPSIILRDLKYVLESAKEVGEPIFQEDEEGLRVCIGKSFVFLDRPRLAYPTVREKDGVKYLDCVSRVN